jgi:hypothetical protein
MKDVFKYREYDRTRLNGGKLSPDEWDKLEASIKKSGIRDHGILQIDRNNSNGNMEVLLGEGNHRLAIGKRFGIKKMKLRISYYP